MPKDARRKHSQPRGRGVQFQIGAVLQHSNTPSPRVAGFEDEDDDEYENEAPHERPKDVARVLPPPLIHIPLITMFRFELFDVRRRFFCRFVAGLFDDRMQSRINVFGHSLGITAHIEVSAVLQPCP
jgi:hypothetical protein